MKQRIKGFFKLGLLVVLSVGSTKQMYAQTTPHHVEVKGISEATFAPSGNIVALGGQDNLVYLLDPNTGAVMHKLTGHEGMVTYLAFSKDGKWLFTGSADRAVKQWNMETKALVRTYGPFPSNIINIVINFNTTKILAVSDDGTLRGYNVQTGAKLYELPGDKNLVKLADFSADGLYFTTCSEVHNGKQYNATTGAFLHEYGKNGLHAFKSVRFSPNGALIATASDVEDASIYNAKTFAHIRRLGSQAGYFHSLKWSNDASVLISGAFGGPPRVWDGATGAMICEFKGHTEAVNCVNLNVDASLAISSGYDNTAKVWNAKTGVLVKDLGVIDGTPAVISNFSPKGEFAYVVTSDGTFRLYKLF
ncbi:MAG: WD40 repeat domain-containing protein [Bacteroidota bacterium]